MLEEPRSPHGTPEGPVRALRVLWGSLWPQAWACLCGRRPSPDAGPPAPAPRRCLRGQWAAALPAVSAVPVGLYSSSAHGRLSERVLPSSSARRSPSQSELKDRQDSAEGGRRIFPSCRLLLS